MQILVRLIFLLLPYLIVGQRIDSLIHPFHYDLVLLPIINGNNPILCGHVFIDLELKASTNLLTFHGADITIMDASVELIPGPAKNISRFDILEDLCFSFVFQDYSGDVDIIQPDEGREQISVIFKRPLLKFQRYRIGLSYVGQIRKESKGFFRANYKNDQDSCCHHGWFAGTQMEATHARRVLPCIDEPGFKATFDITIGHQRSISALSNMPENTTREMTYSSDWKWTTFSRSPPMATYLLAVFLTDYKFVEAIYKTCDRSTRMRFWGRPDQLPHLQQAVAVVPKMLSYLETYLQQPFSLPKIDYISSPMPLNFVAMENWGLILFEEKSLIHDEKTDSEKDRFEDVQTMAHELAHQFFGNLVTSDWWSDIWFNEGFSCMLESALVKHAMPSLTYYSELAWVSSIQSSMKIEELQKSNPIIRFVETSEEVENLFDVFTYNKGSAVLFMLRNIVGHQKFRDALITYMERYKFQNVNSKYFMEILNDHVHQNREIGRQMNITTIMDSWTSQPSYPIIHCSRLENGRIRLSQSSYAQISSSNPETSFTNVTWWIPISITDGRRADFSTEGISPRVWLTPERPTLEIAYFPPGNDGQDQWIVINGQISTYSRVMYDEAGWRLIARQLLANRTIIPQVTRSQIVDDAFTFAFVERLDYHVVLDLIEYLTITPDEFVLPTAVFHLKMMKDRVRSNVPLYEKLENYIARLNSKTLSLDSKFYVFARSGAEDLTDNLGCELSDEGICVDESLRLFHAQMDGTISSDENKLLIEDLERYWCVAIRSGGKKEWERVWRASLSDNWALQRTKILSAMSCSQDRGRLKQLLSRVFNSPIEQQARDSFTLIEKIAENPFGRPMALSFMKTNWKKLEKYFSKSNENWKLLASIAKFLSTPAELEEVTRLIASRKAIDKTLDVSLTESILDRIRRNINWTDKWSNEINELLDSRNSKQMKTMEG